MAIEDLGALEVGRVPGVGDVHRARTGHDGGDDVGGKRRNQDVLVAGDEQHRAAGRRQLLRRAGPERDEPLADGLLVEVGVHVVDVAIEEMQRRLLGRHARAGRHVDAAPGEIRPRALGGRSPNPSGATAPARGCGLDRSCRSWRRGRAPSACRSGAARIRRQTSRPSTGRRRARRQAADARSAPPDRRRSRRGRGRREGRRTARTRDGRRRRRCSAARNARPAATTTAGCRRARARRRSPGPLRSPRSAGGNRASAGCRCGGLA